MIRVDFIVDDDARVSAIRFFTDGLTGYEKTDTIKSALEAMAIENPTVSFSKLYNEGLIQQVFNESEIAAVADASLRLSDLWQYSFLENPQEKEQCAQMTPLQLLANALNLILEQQQIIDFLSKFRPKD